MLSMKDDVTELETDLPACGFIKADKDRKVLSCNHYAMNLLSCESTDDVVELNLEELFSFATRIFLDSYTYPMLLSEGQALEVQLSLKSMAGEIVPIVANIQMNQDKTTCWTFMGCANRDQLYNELLTARDTLQSQALALTQLNDKIQERQLDLQAFCQSLSHDFTGPLRRIHQMIDYALEDLQADGVEKHEAYKMLSSARNNADTLLELSRGLVEYLVADVVVSNNEVIDLEEIVSTVLAVREQHETKKPIIQRRSLPILTGSKAQMQVLFKNLIENAIRYNENDPVIIISHVKDVDNSQIVIAVEDNGIGMDDAYVDTIFTPFTRLNSSDQYKGSGLGLSIVKKMVINHGGDIRVESMPGRGSTFYISLPSKA